MGTNTNFHCTLPRMGIESFFVFFVFLVQTTNAQMELVTNFSFDCGQPAHKHRKNFASLLFFFRFILHVCNRRPTCLPPQRDIHTMSRGTTLFSCGSVGEFMPFVFCVVFFFFFLLLHPFFAILKRNVAAALTTGALGTTPSAS